METIERYLESMFAGLPNTPEVVRAKNELRQMMEDKYNELIADGKSDNEAVGTVIAEFGNLDELSEELGIRDFVNSANVVSGRVVTRDEAQRYLDDEKMHAFREALGVMLCILSVNGPILMEDLTGSSGMNGVLGVLFFMGAVAAAVCLFVYSSTVMKKWGFLKKEPCVLDPVVMGEIKAKKEHYQTTHAMFMMVGVVLCVICWLPAAFLDELGRVDTGLPLFGLDMDFPWFGISLPWSGLNMHNVGAMFLFVFAGAGVFLIIYTNTIKGSYGRLLKLGSAMRQGSGMASAAGPTAQGGSTMQGSTTAQGGSTVQGGTVGQDGSTMRGSAAERQGSGASKESSYISPMAEAVMSMYWLTVTCLYLIWSFLSFRWSHTWILWPVAAVVYGFLNKALRKEGVG